MNAFTRELALHHQRHQHLLPHQSQTRGLCRGFGNEELHLHRMPLPDAPRAARGLSQRMERISGLVEVECRECQKIESCLYQLRMTDHDFNAVLKLLLIPKLSLEGWHCGPKHSDSQPCLTKHSLQASGNIVLTGKGRIDLATPS